MAKVKSKMQNVSFNDVSELIDFLPEEQRAIVLKLRKIIQNTLPQATERLSYNVPFYRIKTDICFIWPEAVLWGKANKWEGVQLGFRWGSLLSNENNYFEMANRKEVGIKIFNHVHQIKENDIVPLLIEAMYIDERLSLKKKKTGSRQYRKRMDSF